MTLQAILEDLRARLIANVDKCQRFGLCHNIWTLDLDPHQADLLNFKVKEWTKTWPLYTGEEAFPVPAPLGWAPVRNLHTLAHVAEPYTAKDLACTIFLTGSISKYNGVYGHLRFQLLDHWIACAEADGL